MKNLIVFVALLCLPFGIFATDCIPDCGCETDWTLEVRGAYYSLPSKPLNRVYTSHWLDYQVEVSKRVYDFIEIWGGVSWASKHGHARRSYDHYAFHNRTKIFVLPVSLGVKWIYPILPCVDAYLGAGVCYSFLKIKEVCKEEEDSYYSESHSSFKKDMYKNDFGGIFKVGFQFALSASTFLDFFVDYYAQRFHLSHHTDRRDLFKHHLDCSGFKFGMGFGVYF